MQDLTPSFAFENVLTSNSDNEFIAIDLGDNYPRGINLHRFTKDSISSHVVYSFKTAHGQTPANPAGVTYPKYVAISSELASFYQWSNDNNTYTELGGVIENTDGYSIIFAGEPDANGKALNNARVGSELNDARNIGLVKIVRNFTTEWGNIVSDTLVLSNGITETGGFYTFGGNWSEQQNTGVVWLTDYLDKTQTNVSHLKSVKLAENKILLLWENWNESRYIDTYAMTVDSLGNVLHAPIALGEHVRLDRRDDPFVMADTVYLVSGDEAESKLELISLKIK